MNVKFIPLSVIYKFSYAGTATLRIIFVSEKVYDYINVSEEIYQLPKFADSKSTYLNKHIKGFYTSQKIK